MKILLFAMLSAYTSCLLPDPETMVVKQVKKAGGDPVHSTVSDLSRWFVNHQTLAVALKPECEAAVTDSGKSSRWPSESEGRICLASLPIAQAAIGIHFEATN